jgi:hypothetical protein
MINLTHLSTEKVQAFRQRQANNGRQHTERTKVEDLIMTTLGKMHATDDNDNDGDNNNDDDLFYDVVAVT